jgi:hypothetical protein
MKSFNCPHCHQPIEEPKNSDFDIFWKAYPRKTGKGAALKAWEKNKLPPLETILLALKKAIQSHDWQKDKGLFIPHASTWLNQSRWEDEGIDYEILSQRKPIMVKSKPEINENQALHWLRQNYDTIEHIPVIKYMKPFNEWPQMAQEAYYEYLK